MKAGKSKTGRRLSVGWDNGWEAGCREGARRERLRIRREQRGPIEQIRIALGFVHVGKPQTMVERMVWLLDKATHAPRRRSPMTPGFREGAEACIKQLRDDAAVLARMAGDAADDTGPLSETIRLGRRAGELRSAADKLARTKLAEAPPHNRADHEKYAYLCEHPDCASAAPSPAATEPIPPAASVRLTEEQYAQFLKNHRPPAGPVNKTALELLGDDFQRLAQEAGFVADAPDPTVAIALELIAERARAEAYERVSRWLRGQAKDHGERTDWVLFGAADLVTKLLPTKGGE